MPIDDLNSTASFRLARVMEIGRTGQSVWHPDDLSALLEHALASPVKPAGAAPAGHQSDPAAGAGPCAADPPRTIGELLTTRPDARCLEWLKEYAKVNCDHPESPMPAEIAKALYMASIVAAMLRCGRRISSLDDASLCRGIRLLLQQGWLLGSIRGLLEEGLRHLSSNADNRP